MDGAGQSGALPLRGDGLLGVRRTGSAGVRGVMHCTSATASARRPASWRAAGEVARLTGVKEFMHLKIDLFRRIGGSALTDASPSPLPMRLPDGGGPDWQPGNSGDLCSLPQRAFSFRGGELGGGSGGEVRS